MSTEVSALGLSVDSRDVVSATDNLNKFTKSTDDAGKATDRLRDANGRFLPGAKKLGDEMAKAGGKARGATGAFQALLQKITGIDASMGGLERAATRLGARLVAAFGVKAVIDYADAWSDMQSKVGAAIKDMSAAPELMGRMVDLANASYSPLSQTVEVYTRNVGVLRALGKSATEAADFTEALNHALVVTATRGERAASVQNALSKAMAVGKLQADGLETVMANGGRVAEALAERLGTNVNGLRAMASQGKITSAVIAGALLDSLEKLRSEAAEMPATVADGMTRIATGMQYLVGILDQTTGASGSLAGVLVLVGDTLANVAKWASENGDTIQFVFDSVIGTAIVATAALAVKFAATWVGSMYASAAATGVLSKSLVLLRAALVASGIGIAVVVAGVLVGQILKVVQAVGSLGEAWKLMSEAGAEAFGRLRLYVDAFQAYAAARWLDFKADMLDLWADVAESPRLAWDMWIEGHAKVWGVVKSIWEQAPDGLGSIMWQAGQKMLEALLNFAQKAMIPLNMVITAMNFIANTDFKLGDLVGMTMGENPFSGAKAPDLTLDMSPSGARSAAGTAREQAEAYREAGNILTNAASRPMTAWERLKSIFAETDEVVKETTTDTTVLGDALAGAGGKGKKAAEEAKDGMMTLKSATEDFRGTMSQAFSGLVTGATSLRDAVGNIIGKLAEMAATRGFEFLWNGKGGKGGIGGAMGGFLGSLLGFADGGVFSGGRVTAFADGGVVHGPTMFPMVGGTGLMGEAGPEAIMPLKRGSDGKLGVKASGGGSGARGPVEIILHAPVGFSAEQLGEIEGVSVRVVSEASPQIIQQSVQSTGRAMRKTKAFGNGSI